MNKALTFSKFPHMSLAAISRKIDRLGEAQFAHLLLVPVYALVVIGLGFPLLYSLYLSLFDLNLTRAGNSPFVGLGNYLALLSDPLFQKAVPATFLFMCASTISSILIALALALLLTQPIRGRTFYRVVLLVPWAVPPIVNGWMWLWMFNQNYGAINALLQGIGIIDHYVNWLGSTETAFTSLVVAETWKDVPFLALLLLARLLVIPQSLYRAAKVDGANFWQLFRYITLPGIRQTLLIAIVLQSMWSLKVFDLIYIMTRGQPNDSTMVLNYMVYLEAFKFLNVGYGAAAAWTLSGLIVILTVLYLLIFRER